MSSFLLRYGATARPSYSTNFALTENPISEGGNWLNGGTVVLDSTNVQTTPGFAFATQVAGAAPPFTDSLAILDTAKFTFGMNQWCQGTVAVSGTPNLRELELRTRSRFGTHLNIGYEWDITTNFGLFFVRLDGPANTFQQLGSFGTPAGFSVANGAVWLTQFFGSVSTIFCNSGSGFVQIASYDTSGDSIIYPSGNPGIGMYADTNNGTPSANNTLGWSSFSAGQI
jgi:hypothetical protein